MQNVTLKQNGKKLTIEIDMSATAVRAAKASASGKTKLLASTHGAVDVGFVDGAKLSLNLTIPPSA